LAKTPSIANYEFPDPSVSPVFHTGCVPGCAPATCSCTKSLPITGYYRTSTTSAASTTHAWGVSRSRHYEWLADSAKYPAYRERFADAREGAAESTTAG
jgi:hypothetical protein